MSKCHACKFSSMAPDDDYLVCNNRAASTDNVWGTYIKGPITLRTKLSLCGEERKLFQQHSLRGPNGELK